MKTTTMKTESLEGAALDWAVAQAVGKNPDLMDVCCGYGVGAPPECCCDPDVVVEVDQKKWSPTTLWEQGGPLIEQHEITVDPSRNGPWSAADGSGKWVEGSHTLIAAMRAIVGAKLGDTVEVPAELAGTHQ